MLQLQLPLHSQLLQHASQSCHPALDTLIKPVRVTVTVTVSEYNVVIAFNWFSINFALDCGLVSLWIKLGVRVCVCVALHLACLLALWQQLIQGIWPAHLCQRWHTYIAAHTLCHTHILQIICCVCGSKATKPANWNCSCNWTELNWTGNKTQSKSHNRVESKLNSLNNCELQTKMQLGSKLIALL